MFSRGFFGLVQLSIVLDIPYHGVCMRPAGFPFSHMTAPDLGQNAGMGRIIPGTASNKAAAPLPYAFDARQNMKEGIHMGPGLDTSAGSGVGTPSVINRKNDPGWKFFNPHHGFGSQEQTTPFIPSVPVHNQIFQGGYPYMTAANVHSSNEMPQHTMGMVPPPEIQVGVPDPSFYHFLPDPHQPKQPPNPSDYGEPVGYAVPMSQPFQADDQIINTQQGQVSFSNKNNYVPGCYERVVTSHRTLFPTWKEIFTPSSKISLGWQCIYQKGTLLAHHLVPKSESATVVPLQDLQTRNSRKSYSLATKMRNPYSNSNKHSQTNNYPQRTVVTNQVKEWRRLSPKYNLGATVQSSNQINNYQPIRNQQLISNGIEQPINEVKQIGNTSFEQFINSKFQETESDNGVELEEKIIPQTEKDVNKNQQKLDDIIQHKSTAATTPSLTQIKETSSENSLNVNYSVNDQKSSDVFFEKQIFERKHNDKYSQPEFSEMRENKFTKETKTLNSIQIKENSSDQLLNENSLVNDDNEDLWNSVERSNKLNHLEEKGSELRIDEDSREKLNMKTGNILLNNANGNEIQHEKCIEDIFKPAEDIEKKVKSPDNHEENWFKETCDAKNSYERSGVDEIKSQKVKNENLMNSNIKKGHETEDSNLSEKNKLIKKPTKEELKSGKKATKKMKQTKELGGKSSLDQNFMNSEVNFKPQDCGPKIDLEKDKVNGKKLVFKVKKSKKTIFNEKLVEELEKEEHNKKTKITQEQFVSTNSITKRNPKKAVKNYKVINEWFREAFEPWGEGSLKGEVFPGIKQVASITNELDPEPLIKEDPISFLESWGSETVGDWVKKKLDLYMMHILANHLRFSDSTIHIPLKRMEMKIFKTLRQIWLADKSKILKAHIWFQENMEGYEGTRRCLTLCQQIHNHTINENWRLIKSALISNGTVNQSDLSRIDEVLILLKSFQDKNSTFEKIKSIEIHSKFGSTGESTYTVLNILMGRKKFESHINLMHITKESLEFNKWISKQNIFQAAKSHGINVWKVYRMGYALQIGSETYSKTIENINMVDFAVSVFLKYMIPGNDDFISWNESPERAWLIRNFSRRYFKRLNEIGSLANAMIKNNQNQVKSREKISLNKTDQEIIDQSDREVKCDPGNIIRWFDAGISIEAIKDIFQKRKELYNQNISNVDVLLDEVKEMLTSEQAEIIRSHYMNKEWQKG